MNRRSWALVAFLALLTLVVPVNASAQVSSPLSGTLATATAEAPGLIFTDAALCRFSVGETIDFESPMVTDIHLANEVVWLDQFFETVDLDSSFIADGALAGGYNFAVFGFIPDTTTDIDVSCQDGRFTVPLGSGAGYTGYYEDGETQVNFGGSLYISGETIDGVLHITYGFDAAPVVEATLEEILSDIFGESSPRVNSWLRLAARINSASGAVQEHMLEVLDRRLDAMVRTGFLTQPQADDIANAILDS